MKTVPLILDNEKEDRWETLGIYISTKEERWLKYLYLPVCAS